MSSPIPLYRERQHSRQWWLLALIGFIALLNCAIFVQQIIRNKPVGNNPMSDWGVVVLTVLLGLGLPALILWLHMETVVYADRLVVSVIPFSRRVIEPADIAHVAVRTVRPIREFGGWGVRGWGGNRAYLMEGNSGVSLNLINGSTLFLGSRRSDELAEAIATMMGSR